MKLKNILLSFILLLSVFLMPLNGNAASKKLNVHFIDVGQGDSIYIKAPSGENILIDAGNKGKGKTVVAYLKKQKVKQIDIVISTHPDADHLGGFPEVFKAFKVKKVYAPKVSHTTLAYKNFLLSVKNQKLKITTAKKGVSLPIKDKKTTAKFIAPVRDYAKSDLNNWSAVLLIKHVKKTFLLTGDAELASEKDMLAKKLVPKLDVLKAGHHGSKFSTSADFLKKARPTYTIISVGKNGYGHPTSEVLNRLKAVKSKVYRTDKHGNIIVTSTGSKITIRTAR